MILLDKMKNLKIYRQGTFLPTEVKDKKKGSAILLLTPSLESSKRLMSNPLFINKKRFESYYLERDIAFYIGANKVEDIEDPVEESVLYYIEETKRSELPDSAFGVPSKRKFPLDTEAHVRSAIKFFNYVDPEDEEELARRIIAAMKKYNITDVKVSEKNRFSKYYHPKEKYTNESYIEEANKLKIYYGLTEEEANQKTLEYKGNSKYTHKGVNTSLSGLKKFIKDNKMEDIITKYTILDSSIFNIDDSVNSDEKYDMIAVKIPFKFNIGKVYDLVINESYIEEATSITRKHLYHISTNNLDGIILQPSVPSNYLTKNGYEDNYTKRVCFCSSINKCLRALSENLEGKEFYVMIPDGEYDVYKPTTKEVPDSNITGELWIREPVRVKTIAKIRVLKASDKDGIQYSYGNNKTAELYDWDWEYTEKYVVNESTGAKNLRYITSDDGAINACIDIEGYQHPFRARSSMLILKPYEDTYAIYLKYDNEENEYHAPGGGWNENENPMDAAIREAREEAYINVSDVSYEGTRIEYYDEVRDWVKDHVANQDDWWYGYYSEIFVGMYESDYTGEVEDIDQDSYINSGDWYKFDDIKDDICNEYRTAVENYIARLEN